MTTAHKSLFLASVAAIALAATSCSTSPDDPGLEYAPQMYHSIPYEPYSQVTDTTSEYYNTIPYNSTRSNQRLPVPGTIARKYFAGQLRTDVANDIMVYGIPADSLDMAARTLRNPLPNNESVVAEGKILYERYCAPCHGVNGDGGGKVNAQYKGVPSYKTGRYATLNEGHIYHVITYGKGRMFPHGSQVNPDERWKIVRYVQQLQKAS